MYDCAHPVSHLDELVAAATMYYPVEVEGALLSMGDCHGHQGDGESAATGIETSLDGTLRQAAPPLLLDA